MIPIILFKLELGFILMNLKSESILLVCYFVTHGYVVNVIRHTTQAGVWICIEQNKTW